ncbi:MAG: twin-arginine translocation signal domain-containing protein, partial [Planctomycetes bacterium]|nr:twin-arginine translocation signal domain-containing protein [Planctomycetota bacterium]
MTTPVSRRDFLSASGSIAAAATMASTVSWTAKSYARVIGANDRIGVGVIGAGVIGTAHLNVINNLKARDKNNLSPVAVADCWKTRADKGRAHVEAEHSLVDYRKLLEMKEVDYVVVAVPEHWHSTMTIDALDAGKAVYCEKPMTHTIPEAQAVMKKQKETGLPLQIGVQAMSDD